MNRRAWTDDETALVMVNGQTAAALASQLGRSVGSVEMKRKRLSNKPPRKFWTESEIALALKTGSVPGRTLVAVEHKLRVI